MYFQTEIIVYQCSFNYNGIVMALLYALRIIQKYDKCICIIKIYLNYKK